MATLTQVFTSLADKIRSKLGTTTKYTPAQAISAIDDVYEKGVSEGTTPTQEKTVTAGTSAKTVTPDSGYALSKVTVNPTPSQTKSVTAGTSDKTVSPDSGKLLSKVTVSPTPSQTKSASPSTSAQTISPDSGKLLSSVSISAISPQRNPTTPNQATISGHNETGPYVFFPAGWWPSQNDTYGSYVYMSDEQAQQAHAHTGTRASVTSNGTIDLGVTHNIRYVPVAVSSGMVNQSTEVYQGTLDDNGYGQNITYSFTASTAGLYCMVALVYGGNSSSAVGTYAIATTGTMITESQIYNTSSNRYCTMRIAFARLTSGQSMSVVIPTPNASGWPVRTAKAWLIGNY